MLARFAALLILMLPAIAWGEADLRVSLAAGLEYDNNVFRTSEDQTQDVLFRIGPRIRFRDERENLDYNFSYRLPYSRGFETRQDANFDQFFTGGLSYRFTPRTRSSPVLICGRSGSSMRCTARSDRIHAKRLVIEKRVLGVKR